jgi:S1-C subfamily serine protease
MVAAVVRGSPADSAGLVPADAITRFDGHSISSPTTLTALVTRLKPGARVSLAYADRLGRAHTATVILASGPSQ